MATLAETVQTATQRTAVGLSEQGKGATEIAKAMDATRKEAMQTARGLVEQARAGKLLEQAARQVSSLATAVTRATSEQRAAAADLATTAERMRQTTRQSARAQAEQTTALDDLAGAALKQQHTTAAVARSIAEQSAAQEKLEKTLEAARVQLADVAAGSNRQSQRGAAFTTGLRQLAEHVQSAASVNGEHAKRFAGALQLLAEARPEPAAEPSTGPS
jgi:methyl-accepting chemotaxis protein